MLSKSLRLPLFGLLGLAAVGLGASLFFFDDEESSEATSKNNELTAKVPKPAPKPFTLKLDDAIGFNAPTASNIVEDEPEVEATDTGATEATPPVTPATTVASSKGQPVKYIVQNGDVLGRIVRKFGCTIDDVKRLNPSMKDVNKIIVGKPLIVLDVNGIGGDVVEGQPAKVETVKAVEAVSSDNGIKPEPVVEDKSLPTRKAFRVAREHVLKNGDTYFSLSQRYYGSERYWSLLRDANPDWDIIRPVVGSTIVIPALEGSDQPDLVEGSARKGSGVIPKRN